MVSILFVVVLAVVAWLATRPAAAGGGSTNQAPTASIALSPTSPTVGDTVTADASGSTDPDGEIVAYTWLITRPDGSTQEAEGITTTFTADVAGGYTAALTVEDDDGEFATATQSVTATEPAANDPPVASFTYSPQSPIAGDTVSLDASGSSDPDGTIAFYAWTITTPTGSVISKTSVTTTFVAEFAGTYTIDLTVTDDEGATGSASQTTTVQSATNQPPVASFTYSPQSPVVGDFVSLDASESSDPDGTIVSYDWTIDRPTESTGTRTGVTAGFNATEPGEHVVDLVVTDDAGATTTATQTIEVQSAGVIESFENGLVDWTGDVGRFTVVQDATEGAQAIRADGDTGATIVYVGPATTPQRGDVFAFDMRPETSLVLARFEFFRIPSAGYYYLVIDTRDAELGLREVDAVAGTDVVLDRTFDVNWALGQYHRITIDTSVPGEIIVTVTDPSGAVLGSITGVSSLHDSGTLALSHNGRPPAVAGDPLPATTWDNIHFQ